MDQERTDQKSGPRAWAKGDLSSETQTVTVKSKPRIVLKDTDSNCKDWTNGQKHPVGTNWRKKWVAARIN